MRIKPLNSAAFLLAASAMFCAGSTWADYPDKPIRVVVPYGAGGNPDLVVRKVSVQLSAQMGQPLVIENRAGASGLIGIEMGSKAAPNGYTLTFITSSLVLNQALRDKSPYDVEHDFAPVTALCQGLGFLMVLNTSSAAQNLREFIELAKKGGINYSTSGIANISHLLGEMFNIKAGTKMTVVPYKSSAESLNAVAGGFTHAVFTTPAIAAPLIKAGKVKAIAFSGARRWAGMPDVPTIAEIVPGFQMDAGWLGWLAPPKTPLEITHRVQGEIARAVQDAQVKGFIQASGYEPLANSPEEFGRFMREELGRLREIGKAAKIKLDQ